MSSSTVQSFAKLDVTCHPGAFGPLTIWTHFIWRCWDACCIVVRVVRVPGNKLDGVGRWWCVRRLRSEKHGGLNAGWQTCPLLGNLTPSWSWPSFGLVQVRLFSVTFAEVYTLNCIHRLQTGNDFKIMYRSSLTAVWHLLDLQHDLERPQLQGSEDFHRVIDK